jgi:prepilin peptidase CpaA
VEQGLNVARLVVFFAVLVTAAYTDLAKSKVYDWLTLPAIFLGLALAFIPYGMSAPLVNFILGAVVGGGIFWFFYLFDAVGGGDVKLMAAVGALMGLNFTISALVIIAVVGALMALVFLVVKKRLREGLKGSIKLFFKFRKPKKEGAENLTIPYGAAIAAGSMITWLLIMSGIRIP